MDKRKLEKRLRKRVESRATAESRIVETTRQYRECGSCTACCTLLHIDELDKPVATPCQHECAAGCAIYQQKPASCSAYECLWRAGNIMEDEYRPDKLGVIFDMTGTRAGCNMSVLERHRIIIAREMYEKSSESPAAQRVIMALGTRHPVLVMRYMGAGQQPVTGKLSGAHDLVMAVVNDPQVREATATRRQTALAALRNAIAGVEELINVSP